MIVRVFIVLILWCTIFHGTPTGLLGATVEEQTIDSLRSVYRNYFEGITQGDEARIEAVLTTAFHARLVKEYQAVGKDFPDAAPAKQLKGILPDPDSFDKFMILLQPPDDPKLGILFSFADSDASEAFPDTGKMVQVARFRKEGKNNEWRLDEMALWFLKQFEGAEEQYEAGSLNFATQLLKPFQESSKDWDAKAGTVPEGGGATFTLCSNYPLETFRHRVVGGFLEADTLAGRINIPASYFPQEEQVKIFGSAIAQTEEFGGFQYMEREAIEAAVEAKEQERLAAIAEFARLADLRAQARANKATFGLYQPPATKPSELPVTVASFLGGETERDVINAILIAKNGLVYLGGGMDAAVAGPSVVAVDKWISGFVFLYDPVTNSFLSRTNLGGFVLDMGIDAEENVYVLTSGMLSKWDPTVTRLIWTAPGQYKRFAVTPEGEVFSLNSLTISHHGSDGNLIRQWNIPNKGTGTHTKRSGDIAYDAKNRLVFACGNNSGNSKKSGLPVFVPWIVCYDTEGNEKHWMYNFTHTEVDPNGMADSRISRMEIAPDGKLYFLGDTEGGNTPFNFSPQKMEEKLPASVFAGTPFHEMWRANSARKVTFIGKADPVTGIMEKATYLYGMRFDERRNQEMIGYLLGKDIAVNEGGQVVVTGVSNCKIIYTDNAVHKNHLPETIQNNYGHPIAPDEFFLTVFEENMTKVSFNSGFGNAAEDRFRSKGEAVASRGGITVAGGVARFHVPDAEKENEGYDPSSYYYLKNPVQNRLSGRSGEDGYFVVMGPELKSDERSVLETQMRWIPFVGLANLAAQIPNARSYLPLLQQAQALVAKQPELNSELEWMKDFLARMKARQTAMAANLKESNPNEAAKIEKAVAEKWKGIVEAAPAVESAPKP